MFTTTEASNHRTVKLPDVLASFRSVRSNASPFDALLAFVRRESGLPGLAFRDVFVSRSTFGELRGQTRAWLTWRGDDLAQLDALSWPGITAPLLSRHLAPGVALVKEVA